jgi:hypothetical protein
MRKKSDDSNKSAKKPSENDGDGASKPEASKEEKLKLEVEAR